MGSREALLEKKYYENCPGCKVDRRKELRRGLPIRELVAIWAIVLCTALPTASLFPFLYFMIRDFHIAKTEEDIGFYAGFVGASFMLGRVSTSFLWGLVADRYGRKPVILFGTAAVVILNALFGFSVNYWMAISTRFFLGFLNGSLGTIKAYTTEVFNEEHQAIGLSAVSSAWALGLIIGPAIGGYLAQPAEIYPSIFSTESVFGRFPYLLPCLVISTFALVVLIFCCWLPETLHKHDKCNILSEETLEAASSEYDGVEKGVDQIKNQTAPKESLIRNWPLMSSIILYCVIAFQGMAYLEVFPLWAVSPARYGGLGYSSPQVGEVLAISGFGLLVFQLSLYPYLERLLGLVMLIRISGVLCIATLSSYPFIAKLSGSTLFVLINCASIIRSSLQTSMVTSVNILYNKSVDQNQRGAANGLAITSQSLFSAAGPAAAGAIFSWAEKRQGDDVFLPGTPMVFLCVNIVLAIVVLMTFRPFLARRS